MAKRAEHAQVWLIEISDALVDHALLSPDELRRWAAFHRAEHATQFAATRCVLKKILAMRLVRDPGRLRLDTNGDGRPVLAEADKRFSFSVTHARQLSLIAIMAGGPVGVDLEHVSALSDAEGVKSWLDRIGAPPAAPLLTRWVRLEALAKAAGTGLADIDINGLRVPPDVIVRDIRLPQAWAGAVAVPAWCPGVEFRRWEADDLE